MQRGAGGAAAGRGGEPGAAAGLKRLYTHTYTKLLDGKNYGAKALNGTGKISASSYAGGIKISSGANGAAGLGYSFTIPAEPVFLKVRWNVLGRGQVPTGSIGIQNWTLCTAWSSSCADSWASAPAGYGWSASSSGNASTHISAARVVRGYVTVSSSGVFPQFVDIRDVRVIVTYGILK